MASSIFDIAAESNPDFFDSIRTNEASLIGSGIGLTASTPAPPKPKFTVLLDQALTDTKGKTYKGYEIQPYEASTRLKLATDKFGAPIDEWDAAQIRFFEKDITSISNYYRTQTPREAPYYEGIAGFLDEIEKVGQIRSYDNRYFQIDEQGNKDFKPEAIEALDAQRRSKDLMHLVNVYRGKLDPNEALSYLVKNSPLKWVNLPMQFANAAANVAPSADEMFKLPRLMEKFENNTLEPNEYGQLAKIIAYGSREGEQSTAYNVFKSLESGLESTIGFARGFGVAKNLVGKLPGAKAAADAAMLAGKPTAASLGYSTLALGTAAYLRPGTYEDIFNRYQEHGSFSKAVTEGSVQAQLETTVEMFGGKLFNKLGGAVKKVWKGKPSTAAVKGVSSELTSGLKSAGVLQGFWGELGEEQLQKIVNGTASTLTGMDLGDYGYLGTKFSDWGEDEWTELASELFTLGTLGGASQISNRAAINRQAKQYALMNRIDVGNNTAAGQIPLSQIRETIKQKVAANQDEKKQWLAEHLDSFGQLPKFLARQAALPESLFDRMQLPQTTPEFREELRLSSQNIEARRRVKSLIETNPELALKIGFGDAELDGKEAWPGEHQHVKAILSQNTFNILKQLQTRNQAVETAQAEPGVSPAVTAPEPSFKVMPEHQALAEEYPAIEPNMVYAAVEEARGFMRAENAAFDEPRRDWLKSWYKSRGANQNKRMNDLLDKIQSGQIEDSASIPGFDEMAASYLEHFYGEDAAQAGEGRVWEELKQVSSRTQTAGWTNPDVLAKARERLEQMMQESGQPPVEIPTSEPEPGMPFDAVQQDAMPQEATVQVTPPNTVEVPDIPGRPEFMQGKQADSSGQNIGATPKYIPATTPEGTVKPVPPDLLFAVAKQLINEIKSTNIKGARGQYDVLNLEVAIDRANTQNPHQFRKTLAHEIAHAFDYLPLKEYVEKFGGRTGATGLPKLLGALAVITNFKKASDSMTRDLFTKEEMIEFSQFWRGPWNRKNKGENNYRGSDVELFADFVGAILVSPGEVQTKSPRAWNAFFTELYKPKNMEFLQAFTLMQTTLNNTVQYTKDMLTFLRDGRASAADVADSNQKIIDKERAALTPNAAYYAKNWLFDRMNGVRKLAPHEDFSRQLDEYASFFNRHNRTYHRQMQVGTLKVLADAGVDQELFQSILFYSRIANGGRTKAEQIVDEQGNVWFELDNSMDTRSDYHNTGANTPETASVHLRSIQNDLTTPEQWAAIEAARKNFYDANFRMMQLAYENGIITQSGWEQINLNKENYVTFRVGKYAATLMPSTIKEMVGTFENIIDPIAATMAQMGAFTHFAQSNGLKSLAIGAMQAEGLVHTKSPRNGIHKEVVVMESGMPKSYWIPEYLANEIDAPQMSSQMQWLVRMNSNPIMREFKKFFTTYSPSFLASNPIRDVTRTAVLFSAASGVSMREFMAELPSAIRDSVKSAYGNSIEDIEQAISLGAIPVFAELKSGADLRDLTEILKTYEDMDRKGLFEKIPLAGKFFTFMDRLGISQEHATKLAAFRAAKKKGISDKRAAELVRNFAGTPDTTVRGAMSPLLNTIFMFNSVKMSALRTELGLMVGTYGKDERWNYWKNQLTLLPIRAMPFFLKGLVFYLVAAGLDDEWLLSLRDGYLAEDKVPDYERKRNIILPYGVDDQGNVKYFKLPKYDSWIQMEAVSDMFWQNKMGEFAVDSGTLAKAEMSSDYAAILDDLKESLTWGLTDVNLTPFLEIPAKWWDITSDKVPIDSFTKMPIDQLSQDDWENMGMGSKAMSMANWSLDKFGSVGDTKDFLIAMAGGYEDNPEKFNKAVPVLSRFHGVTKGGDRQKSMRNIMQQEYERKKWSFSRGEATRKGQSELWQYNAQTDMQLADIDAAWPRRKHLLAGMNRSVYSPAKEAYDATEDAQQREAVSSQLEETYSDFYKLLNREGTGPEILEKYPAAYSSVLYTLSSKPANQEWLKAEMRDSAMWKTVQESGMDRTQAYQILRDQYGTVGETQARRLSALFSE